MSTISLLNSQTIDSEKIEENVLKKIQKKLVDDGEVGGNVVLVNKNGIKSNTISKIPTDKLSVFDFENYKLEDL
tara:strand:+ start:5345 stop:5566 length:222 start_codon:yes stop_codon:yes gene_type:complete